MWQRVSSCTTNSWLIPVEGTSEHFAAGQLSTSGGLQVAKCPVCGPVVSGYTIGEAGIVPVDQKIEESRVQSVLEANISAEHQVQEGGLQTQYV